MPLSGIAVAVLLLAAGLMGLDAAHAQSSGTQLSGTYKVKESDGGSAEGSFTCFGRPTCVGTTSETYRAKDCSNTFSWTGTLIFTGADLTAPGPISGTITATSTMFDWSRNTDGSCTYLAIGPETETSSYTGSWDGARGTLSMSCLYPSCPNAEPDHSWTVTVTFGTTASRSNSPPVFPVTVTGDITPTVANARATFQPRAQDAGTTRSTYVFALAPAPLVQGAPVTKADAPVACVLAQLNAGGQLSAASASSLQAYATGVLSAQGQTVTILNNVATPGVAGATFFVGYGSNSAAMIVEGVNVSTVAVPGASACSPQPPKTGWWWNPSEGGRGYSIEARDNKLFFAAFHYDASGRSTWNVASGATSLDGSLFTGDLLSVRGGQTLGGPYTGFPSVTTVGPITLAFNGESNGTMVWPGGTVAIERMNLVPGGLGAAPQPNQPESGWWWSPQEPGRGFFMEWQAGHADIAGYMYDDAGNPVWYIAVYPTPNPLAYVGNWWSYGNGQSMGGPYKPATQLSNNVAPVTITFTSATSATMSLPNGRTTALQRHRF